MLVRRIGAFAVAAALLAGAPSTARADDAGAPARRSGPCRGCKSSLPEGTDPVPLLVLLHGDGESAASIFDLWERAAARRHMAVLALACPASEGCSPNSWWQWNGDPAWLGQQIDRLAELRPIDRRRLWLVGWSGGGTYAGYRTQEIERTFAAIVIHGGGSPPMSPACSARKASVYFLVSPSNPFHKHAIWLRQYYEACDHDVTWTVVRTADHEGERRAIGQYREPILDWLASKSLPEEKTPAEDAGPASTPQTLERAPVDEVPAVVTPPPALPPVRAAWRCSSGQRSSPCGSDGLWLCALGAGLARRRRPRAASET